jgi:hypothetical protein
VLVCHRWPWSESVSPVLVEVSLFEEWVNLKFFRKIGKTAAEILVNHIWGN